MLHFYFGNTDTVFLSLSESVTLDPVYYLFIFCRRVGGADVAVVLTPEYTNDRAEQFDVDTDTVFEDCDPGQYTYIVYEQSDADNLDPNNATEIARGIMMLHKEEEFAFTQPANTTTFIQPA